VPRRAGRDRPCHHRDRTIFRSHRQNMCPPVASGSAAPGLSATEQRVHSIARLDRSTPTARPMPSGTRRDGSRVSRYSGGATDHRRRSNHCDRDHGGGRPCQKGHAQDRERAPHRCPCLPTSCAIGRSNSRQKLNDSHCTMISQTAAPMVNVVATTPELDHGDAENNAMPLPTSTAAKSLASGLQVLRPAQDPMQPRRAK
jgi:hypothetical protein